MGTEQFDTDRSSRQNMPSVFLGCITGLVFNVGWVILFSFLHSF